MVNLKPFVNDVKLYDDFLDYLKLQLEIVHRGLESASDPTQLFRLQGDAQRLKRLMKLREEINGEST